MEGIFVEDMGIDCARFDGDVNRETSQSELKRFKTDRDCRVLLTTVQSGGVGLNIVEANRVAFLDRFFNPMVHAQAEDRAHRLGQEKPVEVVYFDCAGTIDESMAMINLMKKDNSAVLLADGFEIGNLQGLSYNDLSGFLGKSLTEIRRYRHEWLSTKGNNEKPIPPLDREAMKHLVDKVKNSDKNKNRRSRGGAKKVGEYGNGIDDLEIVDMEKSGIGGAVKEEKGDELMLNTGDVVNLFTTKRVYRGTGHLSK